MAGILIRKPSNTPNITNHDDARMFRYALGGYNGVIEKYKNECSYTINGSTFKINSGEIVIDAWQYGIDASGESITVANISGTQYYSVYLEIDLSLIDDQKGTIKSTYDTVAYPTITKGDDLTETQTGIARLELYRLTASSGVISNVVAQFEIIPVGVCKYASTDISKGTIEERLTNLGFRTGTITATSGFSVSSTPTRQGNYILIPLILINNESGSTPYYNKCGNIENNFRPKQNQYCSGLMYGVYNGSFAQSYVELYIYTNGDLEMSNRITSLSGWSSVRITNFGYEANPI